MTALLAIARPGAARSAYVVLLASCLVLMVFSSSPPVREIQSGVAFAFRPIQGAVDSVARRCRRPGRGAITEIDKLRRRTTSWRRERACGPRTRGPEIQRENELLTACSSSQPALGFKTVAAHGRRARIVGVPARRHD